MRFSIITDDLSVSFLSGKPTEDIHHCIFGRGRRKIAEREGFIVGLTHEEHMRVHENREAQLHFIKLCQAKYEETHSRQEFIKLIGRNYLG